ncbi:class II glutamine amidotransferase [Rhodococcus sp. SGAir0479]|uniref:class II glutamine amidotransferase n=1 Tax=Rhodococcus sp. SGAir0479 TaxID=2567884 RepID=UPI0010CD254E|nr:class II glutamine amidotransferase [Rhodococcus sp. SGAir0479]QCQ91035.1 class II glutamine amidotransferase [Rhodococcus sp. SGAir0479]
MCRLFGMSAAPHRVHATFWLLEAEDSLAEQSRRMPDGTGLGTFNPEGAPRVEKQPLAAYEDPQFAREAKDRESRTFVAHVRYATTGESVAVNTHPFEQKGRLFAHNGVVEDLPALEDELGSYRDLVRGDTDSERFFALITRRIDEHDGDVAAGIASAVGWIADNLRMLAINFVMVSDDEMWAFRYPDTHDLLVLLRHPGGTGGRRHLDHASAAGTVRARSGALATLPAVVVATEQMDEDPAWESLCPGELLHVGPKLEVSRTVILDRAPAHRLTLDDLTGHAAAAQAPSPR